MRNLKRALSLALATVMTLGLMVVGTGAAAVGYDDVTSEDNVEAIEVLQAVGIMTGDENGNFNPDANVTRNEMAVIMSQLLNLDYNYYRGVNPFTDVPSWAAPYVAACAAEGVVAGIGDNLYGGDNNVTAAQAALMILKALGYFQYQADFGSDWQISTIRQASYINLFSGVDANAEQALTRNQVAQLVLNGLQADMVYFTGDVGITVNGVVIGHKSEYTSRTSADSKYNAMIGGATDIAENDQYLIQLGEELYDGDLRLRGSTDNFGRPATTWRYDGRDIGTYTDDADLTYTDGVESGDIYSDLGLSESVIASDVTVIVDGEEQDNSVAIRRGSETKIADSGNGVLTEVYYDDDNNTVLITHINTYVGTIVKSVEADGNDAAYVVVTPEQPINGTLSAPITSGEEFETDEQFADDQYVLYTYSKAVDEIQSVAAAEELNGVVTRAENSKEDETDAKALTIDGTRYTDSKYVAGEELGDISVDEEYTVYLDSYGYLIYVERIDEIGDYALLYANSTGTVFNAHQAYLVFADGTTAVVNTEKVYNNEAALAVDMNGNGDMLSTETVNLPIIVTYRENEDGVYTLRGVSSKGGNLSETAENETDFVMTNDKAGITGLPDGVVTANSASTFVVRDPADRSIADYSDLDWTAYTGIKNAPSITADTPTNEQVDVYYYCKTGSMVTIMFIVPDAAVVVDDGNNSGLYLSAESVGNLIHDPGVSYFVYQGAEDGKVVDEIRVADYVTVVDETGASSQVNGKDVGGEIYARYSTDKNGIITRLVEQTDTNRTDGNGYGVWTGIERTSEAYTVIVGAAKETITVDEDADIFYVKSNGDVTISSYNAIAVDEDDRILAIVKDYQIQTLIIEQNDPSRNAAGSVDIKYNDASATTINANVGDTVTLVADPTVTGKNEVVSYQWYKSTAQYGQYNTVSAIETQGNTIKIAGANTATYTVPTAEADGAYGWHYYVVAEIYNDRATGNDTVKVFDAVTVNVTEPVKTMTFTVIFKETDTDGEIITAAQVTKNSINGDGLLYQLEQSDLTLPDGYKWSATNAAFTIYAYNADGERVEVYVDAKSNNATIASAAAAAGTDSGTAMTVTPSATVTSSDPTFTVVVSTTSSGADNDDTIEVTLTLATGATCDAEDNKVTLTKTDGSWDTATVKVTAEDGVTTNTYTVSVTES